LCKVSKYVVHVVARQVIATKHFAIHRVVAQYSKYSNALYVLSITVAVVALCSNT